MRAVPILAVLSLIAIAGCTTAMKTPGTAGKSPVTDTSFVPPPKELMQKATPEKKLSFEESVEQRRIQTARPQ
ncbi:hypothetical protein M8997_016240 [Phyllobacterium sp. 21LDTY02-6]|uniref:hypothetical protein n=1 Tax=Phyllobacterium sp. 21LDTY02-6 TaxID=2944903 RepID=UPI002022877F|nr:hypothetical protein [Phyllobacterium sp. 21LDTY02-6]MCO4318747.1 hypothetical protein [Phyllobacterium sp. 21LDTY02-6]